MPLVSRPTRLPLPHFLMFAGDLNPIALTIRYKANIYALPRCGGCRFSQQKGFSKAEYSVFSEKGAFPKWNAPFSQQKRLFQVGMLRFLSKRGFSKAECSVFSAKGTFPKRNASFSQKMSSPKLECFIFSEKGSIAVKLHFLRKKGLRVKYVIAPRRNIFDP